MLCKVTHYSSEFIRNVEHYHKDSAVSTTICDFTSKKGESFALSTFLFNFAT